MNTAAETKRYDKGYEDAIEGRVQQSNDAWYKRGYDAGVRFLLDDPSANTIV